MNRTLRILPLVLAALLPPAPAAAGDPPGSAPIATNAQELALGKTVESLLDYAKARNPEYIAMQMEAEAVQERVYPVGALPDPVLRIELENVTNYGSNAGPNILPGRVGDTKYTLMQALPFWGKRDLRREAAESAAEAAQGAAGTTWTEQAARIKTSFAQYFADVRLIRLTREVIDLIDRIERITQARYANGLVPQQDAIRVQVERTAMRNELIELEMEQHHMQSRLNALLSRPSHSFLAEPERLRPLPAMASLDHLALEDRLREKNPQLFADDARIRTAEKNRDLAYKNRYPDLTVGVIPIQTRNQVNELGLMLELSIPLQQESRRSQEREAEKMLDAVRARREATANQLLADLSENLAALDAARRMEQLAQTSLLPQAELTFQAALAGYENGKIDFATLLDAQRQIRKARQDIIKTQAEQQARLADIERLIGEEL
ncbi:Transporter [Georgfuchsia toluolica]|uniref:Transporter n=1 Tax=Georgfuchsia toluolica TaxID=424218 RepID=A0A916N1I3_9PROT|nr:TolC family protein [Georgfuchsia toluolica]CAG4884965.1 Transporter [Georgfuchsia toluolica]